MRTRSVDMRLEVMPWLQAHLSPELFRAVAGELQPASVEEGKAFVELLREAKIEPQVLGFLKKALPQKAYVHFIRFAYLWEQPKAAPQGAWALD